MSRRILVVALAGCLLLLPGCGWLLGPAIAVGGMGTRGSLAASGLQILSAGGRIVRHPLVQNLRSGGYDELFKCRPTSKAVNASTSGKSRSK